MRNVLSKITSACHDEGLYQTSRKMLWTARTQAERALAGLRAGPQFLCPCCGYSGTFLTFRTQKYCLCPKCGSMERHRLLRLTLDIILAEVPAQSASILHFAPDPMFQAWLPSVCKKYVKADRAAGTYAHDYDLDIKCDICKIPLPDESFDIVLATHVLEHVEKDNAAIAEIFRVLKPNGIALLPVPIIAARTTEYGEPHAREENHVRAPGLDYFDRYRAAGFDVEVHSSDQFPGKYQLYIHEDRGNWPNANRPFVPMRNEYPHRDFLPICRKRSRTTSR